MVLLQTKNSKTPSSPLNQQTANEKPLVSFSDLLKGAGNTKDAKAVQNAFVVSVGNETVIKTEKISPKTEMLTSIMKNEEKTALKSDVEFLELNPKIVATLGKEEIKELIHEAKNYLKTKIQESDGYKKAEIKELPTTLKGLIEAAKKFDIDIVKITFEEVRSNAKSMPQTVVKEDKKADVQKEIIPEKKELKSEIPKSEISKEIVSEKKELREEMPKELKAELPKSELSKELKTEAQTPKEIILEKKEVIAEAQKELKSEMPKSEISKEIILEKKELRAEMPKEIVSEKKEVIAEAQKELKSEIPKAEISKEIVSEKKELRAEMPKELKAELPKSELSKELNTEAQTPKEIISEKKEPKVELPKETVLEKQQKVTIHEEAVFKEEYREKTGSERFKETPKELKELPLFKTQVAVQQTTTEQIMQAKAGNVIQKTEQKAPKERADDTLSLLLRGEKLSGENVSLTSDFSVATAKVIAPVLGNENKSLEQLLKGESFTPQQNENSSANIESIATHKADSLEVKMNEAKQMIKYLSSDVKSAIDDYRSPFTRVKVQLNPQNLGEVDLTVVQRGKNLHVNISSNNAAIQTLSMNINELRVQLNNSGINNATFNFSSGSQSSDTNANTGQQQRQNEQKAHQEYNYFENEETHEEVLSSLEIIVPRYI